MPIPAVPLGIMERAVPVRNPLPVEHRSRVLPLEVGSYTGFEALTRNLDNSNDCAVREAGWHGAVTYRKNSQGCTALTATRNALPPGCFSQSQNLAFPLDGKGITKTQNDLYF